MKKLLTLAVVLSALLTIWQAELNDNHASASANPSNDPTAPQPDSGSVTAHKFNDANENGSQDEGEADIPGWLFRLYKLDDGLQLVAEGVTGSDGDVTFSGLAAGRYKLWEELPECWSPTIPGGHYWNGGYYFVGDLSEGQQATASFGNAYTCAPPPETCIDLVKTGPESAYPGDTVTYHFWVHNCGDVILAGGAHVYDLLFGEDAIWDGDLEPDEIHEFDMVYTLPQDLCDGVTGNTEFTNDAWAIGHPPGFPEVRDDDSWTIGIICGPEQNPSIAVEKSTNGVDADTAPGPSILVGDPVNWEYTVTNTGNVSLTDVVITDDVLGEVCALDTLAVDESQVCAVNGTAEAGQYANVGTATGHYEDVLVSAEDPSHYFGANPSIELEKLVSVDDQATWLDTPPVPQVLVGSDVYFRLTVANSGNVTLTEIFLSDPSYDVSGCAITDPLPAGDFFECVIGPFAAEEDLQTNTAHVTSRYSDVYGEMRYEDSDQASYFGANPSIAIEKSTNGADADTAPGPYILVGDPVNWEYVVTNTGNVPLDGISVTDDQVATVNCPQDGLGVDESMTCTANGVAAGDQYTNTGEVIGYYGAVPASAQDPSHYFGAAPSIAIEKSTNGVDADAAPGPEIPAGQEVEWEYVVTNTGNVVLSGVAVTDDQGLAVSCPRTVLEPGETMICSASGVAEAGQYENIGTASGTPPVDAVVSDSDPSHYFGTMDASITIEKKIKVECSGETGWEKADTEPGPTVVKGTGIFFQFTVTNTGNVPLTNITLADDYPGFNEAIASECSYIDQLRDPDEPLLPGWSFDCTIGPFPAEQGQHADTATATGGHDGETYSDEDSAHYFGVAIDVEKYVSIDGDAWFDADEMGAGMPELEAGESVWFKFVVTNTGDIPATSVTLNDDHFDAQINAQCTVPGQLGAGESFTCQIGPIEAVVGVHTNTATASAYYVDAYCPGESTDTDQAHYLGIERAEEEDDRHYVYLPMMLSSMPAPPPHPPMGTYVRGRR